MDGCFHLNLEIEFKLHFPKNLSRLLMLMINYIPTYRTNPMFSHIDLLLFLKIRHKEHGEDFKI